MSTSITIPSNATARTQFLHVKNETYAYRRIGGGALRPLLFLQHFTGTLDNWDPAVTDTLAAGREVILFDNAGVGRSTGTVPATIEGMSTHALAFLDGLGVTTESSQAAGQAFIARLAQRTQDIEPASGPEVAAAQIATFRTWEHFSGERFADLNKIRQPTLVVNGVHDEMIPISNSYALGEHLPNAVLLTYPDSGHGSLFPPY